MPLPTRPPHDVALIDPHTVKCNNTGVNYKLKGGAASQPSYLPVTVTLSYLEGALMLMT